PRAPRDRRGGAAPDRRAGIHRERAPHPLPDGHPRLGAVSGDRSGGLLDPDVARHDDGVSRDHQSADQAAPLRRRRRMASARRLSPPELRMTSDQALDLLSALLQVVVFVSGPVLLASLMAGLIVGIVQAATQINEPSVSFVAKAAAVMVTLLVVGPALAAQLIEYTRNSLQSVEHVVR